MKKKWRNFVYPLLSILLFGICSIFVVSCNQVFLNHDISNEDMNGLIFVNSDISYYLKFYKQYVVEQLDNKENIYEYKFEGKFLNFTDVLTAEEKNDFYVFDTSEIFNYKTREYLYRYEQA